MTKENHRLFLLDAFALIYRAYFAFSRRPLVNSKGQNVSAVSGFVSTLYDLLQKENPTHLAVVFDSPEGSSREVEFEFYKANREAMPEDIQWSIPIIKDIVRAFKIPIIEEAGYEADDLIGTLALKAGAMGYNVYMVTPDKDYGQLVRDNVFMYKPRYQQTGFDVLGVKEICEKWEIQNVHQVIDILSLMGDSVDNIPGIPGVGEKTAKKLIQEFGSLEEIIANADKIKGKLSDKVKEGAEMGMISKKLATIITDAPIEVDENLIVEDPDKARLAELFAELEFRSLGKRILGDDYNILDAKSGNGTLSLFDTEEFTDKAKETDSKSINTTSHNYKLVSTEADIDQLIKDLKNQKIICFDTETTSIDANNCELVGMSFSYQSGVAYYIPVDADQIKAEALVQKFKHVFENESIQKIGQNIKYDILVLKWYGVEVKGVLWDTMVAHYLLKPEQKHSMDALAENYLQYKPVSIEELIGKKGKNQGTMRDVALDKIKDYAAEDADITYQLKEVFEPMLKEENMEKLFFEIESPLIHVLGNIEFEGINLDIDFLQNYSAQLQAEIAEAQSEVFSITGVDFNLDSPKQLGDVLFNHMKIPYTGKKTKTGQYSTSEDVLQQLVSEHKVAETIMNYRELTKLKSTYVDALPQMVNPKTGRVHSSFNQTIAATGRLSSNNPNLQNIPIKTARGREIRKAFIPRNDEFELLSADYSQIELRIIASLSEDEAMMQAFHQGQDIHAATASKVFGVAINEVSREMRGRAKAVNFGIAYGQTAFGLSQQLGIKRGEAQEIIDNFFKQFPGVRKLLDTNIAFAREHGYILTMCGRKRYLPDIHSRNFTVRGFAERNAINTPIQGSAADMIKIAMIKIDQAMQEKKMKSRMLLQVHDELVFDVHHSEKEEMKNMVEQLMQSALPLKVPVVVESGYGKNWLEAH
ncbi:MAG TPA: DNA polymerase I [Bacteroidia bacterium]|nr:DNA polymerase I [Bacteroidia bacterium]